MLPDDWYEQPTETIISKIKPEPDEWFDIELKGTAAEEFKELLRFEEHEPPVPEYQPYMNATHQR
jgi:hypothetical protein